jgi:uncharacterized protein (DUF302 family)
MKKIITGILLTLGAMSLQASNGIVNVLSPFSVEQTTSNLEFLLEKKGMTLFNKVEHSKAANKVGIELKDTQLLIFGNPNIGSKLMECKQSVAIDLPQKFLIWQDDEGDVFISYNSPQYLKERHKIEGCDAILTKVEKALAGITKAATK